MGLTPSMVRLMSSLSPAVPHVGGAADAVGLFSDDGVGGHPNVRAAFVAVVGVSEVTVDLH
ncbi:hypothetical protein ACQB60_35235 [Actinomycetota bacterium Odt1-20B]